MCALVSTKSSALLCNGTCCYGRLQAHDKYAISLISTQSKAFTTIFNISNSRRSFTHLTRCQAGQDNIKKGKIEQRTLLDNASNLLTNFLNQGTLANMPIAEGAVSDLFGRPLFFALYDWFIEHGPVYKLAFGPKAFVVVSDPIVARHILRENAFGYDKVVQMLALPTIWTRVSFVGFEPAAFLF